MRSKEELIKLRLPWDKLTQAEQDMFNNGFGPSWLGPQARAFITQIAGYFLAKQAGATTIMDIALVAMNADAMNVTLNFTKPCAAIAANNLPTAALLLYYLHIFVTALSVFLADFRLIIGESEKNPPTISYLKDKIVGVLEFKSLTKASHTP